MSVLESEAILLFWAHMKFQSKNWSKIETLSEERRFFFRKALGTFAKRKKALIKRLL